MPHSQDRRIWVAAGLGALGVGAALQLRHARRIARDPERLALSDPPTGQRLTVRSADGTVLAAEVFGSSAPDALSFVLAHGWTENRTYWIHQIRELSAQGHRVVAFDLRGHGDSEAAKADDYAIARFGEDLEAVLVACSTEPTRTIVAGHSLGAMTIVSWAQEHDVEARVAGVGLFNTGVGDLIAEQLLFPVPPIAKALNKAIATHGFLGSRAPLPRFSSPVSHALIRYIAFGPTASPAQIAFYERMLIASPPDARASIGIALSELELSDALPRLTVPTLVVAGQDDRLTPPSHARRIAEALPLLERLVILPRTGHMAPLERPSEISQALNTLAARVATGSEVASV